VSVVSNTFFRNLFCYFIKDDITQNAVTVSVSDVVTSAVCANDTIVQQLCIVSHAAVLAAMYTDDSD